MIYHVLDCMGDVYSSWKPNEWTGVSTIVCLEYH